MKNKFLGGFLLLLLSVGLTPVAEAGHLFTQASSNTPINLTAGFGISITQDSYEGGGSSGQVTLDFNDEATTNDPNKDWSAGDVLTITMGSWTQTYAYDTAAGDTDLTNVSQDGGGFNATDATLNAASITPADGDTWTVLANAGAFTFSGYRIYVNGKTFNGTGAGPINQDQVVTEDELGGGTGFEPAAESNQSDLGQHLDDIGGSVSGDLATIITELDGLEDAQKAAAMKQMSPEQSNAVTQSVASSTSTSLDTVQVRLDSLRFGTADGESSGLSSGDDELSKFQDRHTWIKFIGGKSKRDEKGGFAGSDSDFAGIMVGVDATTAEKLTLGAAFAYGKTDVSLNDYRDGDSADIDTYQLTGYFTYPVNKMYLEGMVSYAKNDYSTSRNTHISGVAKGDFDGEAVSARLVAGYPIHRKGQGTFVPYAGLEALHITQDDYTETGAGVLSLTVADSSADRVGSLLGIKFSFDKQLSDGSILTPTFDARWRHEFKKDGVTTTSSFVGGGGNFQSVGQDVDSDLLGLSARLNWAKTEDYSLGFEVDGEVAEGYVAGNIQLFGTWRF